MISFVDTHPRFPSN